MKLFRRSKQADGWRALSVQQGEVRAVHVRRSATHKPVVTMAVSEHINGATLDAALARLAKSWGAAAEFACTTCVNAGNYEFLPVESPNVAPTELKAAISFVVKDMVEFSNSPMTIDIIAVPHDKNAAQRARSMYAVAIRSALTADIQKCFDAARLSLKVIDIPEMAQRNIACLFDTQHRITIMASFDDDGGLLTFTGDGELFLSRRIDVTLAQLLTADVDARQLHQERTALEIQRSLDHFGRQFNWVSTARLVLAPLGNTDGGLLAFLTEHLDIKVEILNFENILDISAVPQLKSPGNQQRFFLALGLALRFEEKVL